MRILCVHVGGGGRGGRQCLLFTVACAVMEGCSASSWAGGTGGKSKGPVGFLLLSERVVWPLVGSAPSHQPPARSRRLGRCSSRTWEHFWLNEGWTMWLERNLMNKVGSGREMRADSKGGGGGRVVFVALSMIRGGRGLDHGETVVLEGRGMSCWVSWSLLAFMCWCLGVGVAHWSRVLVRRWCYSVLGMRYHELCLML